MARASIGITAGDGGIGYTGPLGPSAYAAIGVSSKALAIADQEPITISQPSRRSHFDRPWAAAGQLCDFAAT